MDWKRCTPSCPRRKDRLFEDELNRILDDPDQVTMVNDKNAVIQAYRGPLKGNPNG